MAGQKETRCLMDERPPQRKASLSCKKRANDHLQPTEGILPDKKDYRHPEGDPSPPPGTWNARNLLTVLKVAEWARVHPKPFTG